MSSLIIGKFEALDKRDIKVFKPFLNFIFKSNCSDPDKLENDSLNALKILKSHLVFIFIILVKSSVVVSAKEPAKYLKIKLESVL